MEAFEKGEVVVIQFPFSDLRDFKVRPALVVAALKGQDLILCQITSKKQDEYAILLGADDFLAGGLHVESRVRPNRIFTLEKALVRYKAGRLTRRATDNIIESIVRILKA